MAVLGAHQRLFVVDAMAGQDALNAARAFGAALPLTGVILTKADGDARGGAALSVREITGKPIVFLGVGEKTSALEAFDAERMAQRILGMGDVVALVESVQRNIEVGEAEKLARKVSRGQSFDLADLRAQLEQVRRMGGLGALMDKLPAQMAQRALAPDQAERQLRQQVAIIDSMTPRERRSPGRHRRLAPAPHCPGRGRPGPGRQPAHEAVPGNAENDEAVQGFGPAAAHGRLPGRRALSRAGH